MKHFLNQELLAPNVLTVPVDLGIVREFEQLAKSETRDPEYFYLRPWVDFSDICWISAASEKSFRVYESAFKRLDVARHVRKYLDLEKDVRFYAGFLHTRSRVKESNFHVDWHLTNNEGFTLITPICGFESGQKLLYKKLDGEVAEYVYEPGEAIIFGDLFQHSTPAGESNPPLSLLVFNFGTDKMEHWDKLMHTQGRQCPLVQRPDGSLIEIEISQRMPAGMGSVQSKGSMSMMNGDA